MMSFSQGYDVPEVVEVRGKTDDVGGVVFKTQKYRRLGNINAFDIFLKEFYCEKEDLNNVESEKIFFEIEHEISGTLIRSGRIYFEDCRLVKASDIVRQLIALQHKNGFKGVWEINPYLFIDNEEYMSIDVFASCKITFSEHIAKGLGFLTKQGDFDHFGARLFGHAFDQNSQVDVTLSYDTTQKTYTIDVAFQSVHAAKVTTYFPVGCSKDVWFLAGTDPFQNILVECSIVRPEFQGTQLVHNIASMGYRVQDEEGSLFCYVPENVQIHNLETVDLNVIVFYLKTITGRALKNVNCLFKVGLSRKTLH